MARIKILAVVLAIVGLSVVAGPLAARWRGAGMSAADARSTGPLQADPASLNFGEVWETDKFEWVIPVKNQGLEAIKVQQIYGSCDCTTIQPVSFTLGPGQTQPLHLTIDLGAKPWPDNRVSLQVVAVTNLPTPESVTQWAVSGRLKPILVCDRLVGMGRNSYLAQPLRPVVVPVSAAVPLEDLTVECLSPFLSATIAPADGSRTRFALTFHSVAILPKGSIDCVVVLRPTGVGRQALPPKRIRVSGHVTEDVESDPPELLGGGRLLGETFTDEFTIRSLTGRSFTVESVATEGAGLVIEKIEAGRFRLSQTAVNPGSQLTKAIVIVRSLDRPETVRVETVVSYIGVSR